MGGTFDDDMAALMPHRVRRENRLHRDDCILKEASEFGVAPKGGAVIAKDSVGCEGLQHAVHVQTGVGSHIGGDGNGKFERHFVLLAAVAAAAAARALARQGRDRQVAP